MKYRTRQTSITYSKEKAEERRNRLRDAENKLNKSEELCAENPSEENIEAFEEVKIEYNSLYDYITQGNIIPSKANWYEKGEKILNIF